MIYKWWKVKDDESTTANDIYRYGISKDHNWHALADNFGVMFAGSASGTLLPPYIVYKADHIMSSWVLGGPKNARYNKTKCGWVDSLCSGVVTLVLIST